MICTRKIPILFSLLFLTNFIGNIAHARAFDFYSFGFGAFQGYQVVIQQDNVLEAKSTIASLPTIGAQFQFQTVLAPRIGFRFKLEQITVKFTAPPEGLLSQSSFQTTNVTIELPYQYNIFVQPFLKIAQKERILYNLDDTLRYDLYKSKVYDLGLGINLDAQNLGGLVTGVGSTASLLYFNSKDINNNTEKNVGFDFEIRAKLGWLFENGWGNIYRTSYSTFIMSNKNTDNTGREIRFFGEIIRAF